MEQYQSQQDDIFNFFWTEDKPDEGINNLIDYYEISEEKLVSNIAHINIHNTGSTVDSMKFNDFNIWDYDNQNSSNSKQISFSNIVKKKYFNIDKLKSLKISNKIEQILPISPKIEDLIPNPNTVSRKKLKKSGKARISFVTNFKKSLSCEEKVKKLKVLSKIVRQYRRKIKNYQKKFRTTSEKYFKKYLNKNRLGNKKDKKTEINLPLKNVLTAIKNIRSIKKSFRSDDNIIQNLIELIADKKLTPNSIHFKKICTQIRLFLEQDKIKHISKKLSKISVELNERKIHITQSELNHYAGLKQNEQAFRVIFGLKNNETPPVWTQTIHGNNFHSIQNGDEYEGLNDKTNNQIMLQKFANIFDDIKPNYDLNERNLRKGQKLRTLD